MTVISEQVIKDQEATNLTDALKNVPGVGAFFAGENGNSTTGDGCICEVLTPQTAFIPTVSVILVAIGDDKKRAMLFELDKNIQSLKARHGESAEILSLLNLYRNLLREWSEI